MSSGHPTTDAVIAAVSAALKHAAEELGPRMAAAGIMDEDQRAENIMQNVLRLCMEVCLQETPGYTLVLPPNLALRLASYAISSLPDHAQGVGVRYVVENLAAAHRDRLRKGIRITTKWVDTDPSTETVQ